MFVAVCGIKGGIAKTSTAVTFAAWLRRSGRRVALLDADPQRSAARWVAGFDDELPVVTVEHGDDPRGSTIEAAQRALELGDVVVADSPPSSLEALRVLLGLSDVVVVPAGPSAEELYLAARTVEMAGQESKMRRGGDSIRCLVVLSRIDPRTTVGRDALSLVGDLGAPVAETVVRHRTAWQEAASAGSPIFDLPAGRAGDAIREATALCEELLRFAEDRTA